MQNIPNILDGIEMQVEEILRELEELQQLIEEYQTDGLRVNEYLLAKVEILKAQLEHTK
jgi:restriction endonuclease S subunit